MGGGEFTEPQKLTHENYVINHMWQAARTNLTSLELLQMSANTHNKVKKSTNCKTKN